MTTTLETRRLSYEEVLKNLGERQRKVFNSLMLNENEGITAGELAVKMHKAGVFSNSDRNNVHPRLNELTALNLVQILGKRKCQVSGRTCAIYKVINNK